MKELKLNDKVGLTKVIEISDDFCVLEQPANAYVSINVYQQMLDRNWELFIPPTKSSLTNDLYIYFRKVRRT